MDKAQIIRQSVSMEQAVEYYGFSVSAKGFMKCPFHQDKTASLRVYEGNKGFACFGCQESGSVIDFVMKLFGIKFYDAIIRISNDFNLGLTEQKINHAEVRKLQEKQNNIKKQTQIKKLIFEWHVLNYKIHENIKATIQRHNELTDEQANAIIQSSNEEAWLLENL